MIISLNGFPINDGTNGAWLDVEIDGLELPEVRTSTGNYAGRDGGWVGAQFFAARAITIQGKVFSSNIATVETTRANLQEALLGGSIIVNITTNAGNQYTLTANLMDFKMPIPRALYQNPFKIELLAPDPIIYQNNTGTLSANISRHINGGYTYPVVYPVVYSAGSSPLSVTNSGSVAVYPTITLNGSMTNPTITNNTTNLFLGLTLTTGPTDQVIINMAQRTITLNGANIFGDQISGSTFWFLEPGGNTISLNTSSSGDTVTGTITWQSGVIGI